MVGEVHKKLTRSGLDGVVQSPKQLAQYLFDISMELQTLSDNINTIATVSDGSTPASVVGFAIIYDDITDGELKVIRGDGTVKTIVTV